MRTDVHATANARPAPPGRRSTCRVAVASLAAAESPGTAPGARRQHVIAERTKACGQSALVVDSAAARTQIANSTEAMPATKLSVETNQQRTPPDIRRPLRREHDARDRAEGADEKADRVVSAA
jgi:hypothetical protein